jgi:spectinomycin phosphotransferase
VGGLAVDEVTHLPVGFGAHHRRASWRGSPRLFVTYDGLAPRHTRESLEAAYAGAAVLAFGLDVVVAGVTTRTGAYTVPLAAGALSATPWVIGERAGDGPPASRADAEATARALTRLHRLPPPAALPVWEPLVAAGWVDDLVERLAGPWDTGPFGAPARDALLAGVPDLRRWTDRYHRLVAGARARPWVATHGEPHSRNQIRSLTGRLLLVDWESLKFAPPERDLRLLVETGHADLVDADPAMVEMFDLEWRLDEISQFADRFAAPHTGGADDREAYDGLLLEIARPG